MDFNYLYTSLDGRINRAKWWAGILILVVVGFVFNLIVTSLFGLGFFVKLLSLIVQVALFYPAYALGAKRFQDRGKQGNYALAGPVLGIVYSLLALVGIVGDPLEMGTLDTLMGLIFLGIGIWYLVDLGILKGTEGANEYGPDPLASA